MCLCVVEGGGRKGQASERRGTEGISEVGEERAGSGVLRVSNIFLFKSGTALLENFPWCNFTATNCRSLFFAQSEGYFLIHIRYIYRYVQHRRVWFLSRLK